MDDDVDEILNQNNVQNTQDDDVDMDDELEDVDVDVPNAEEDEPMDEEEQDEDAEDADDDDDEDEDRSDDEDAEDRSEDDDDDDDDDDERSDDDDDDDDEEEDEEQTENGEEGTRTGEIKQSNTHEIGDDDAESAEKESATSEKDSPSSSDGKSTEMSKLDKIHQYYTTLYRSASVAESYNILPTAAIPIQTNVQALTMSKGLRYLFLGGSDGFIRKFDFLNTVDGKLSLTIQQKNALVDSIVNAGILTSYWENEVPQPPSKVKWVKQKSEYLPLVSPVHSLAVQNECLFILAGQETGGIVMQGVRYFEGRTAHYFKGHKSIVNHLVLNDEETRFLSGSWDKTVIEWDLETGTDITKFNATSQLSSLEFRPTNAAYELPEPNLSGHNPDVDSNNVVGNGDAADIDDVDTNSLFGDDDDDDQDDQHVATNDNTEKAEDNTQQENKDKNEIQEHTSEKKVESETISKNTLALKTDENLFLTSCIDGNIQIWDRRQPSSEIIKLGRNVSTPPWCMSACWSVDGGKVIAGRRNAVVEIYDLRKPEVVESKLKLPSISGPVSKVKAMPNNSHVVAASNDNIRIFDINHIDKTPLIIPGHHGGCISNLYVDPTCRFMISTSGNRGWQGTATDVTLIYDIELN